MSWRFRSMRVDSATMAMWREWRSCTETSNRSAPARAPAAWHHLIGSASSATWSPSGSTTQHKTTGEVLSSSEDASVSP
eukprot:2997580-Pyramimonas_sp.AAC.3